MPEDSDRLLAELAEIQALMDRAQKTTRHMRNLLDETVKRVRKP